MRVLRPSSLEEYVRWYLRREAEKEPTGPIPDNTQDQVQLMWQRHEGKMREWFRHHPKWSVVELNRKADFENLIFLECKWTIEERLVIPDGTANYRLLGRVAENALAENYLERMSAQRHREYYKALANGGLCLQGESRIAICDAEHSERKTNPAGHFYLLDGVGRSLPYMMLVKEGVLKYMPVEAFLAERTA